MMGTRKVHCTSTGRIRTQRQQQQRQRRRRQLTGAATQPGGATVAGKDGPHPKEGCRFGVGPHEHTQDFKESRMPVPTRVSSNRLELCPLQWFTSGASAPSRGCVEGAPTDGEQEQRAERRREQRRWRRRRQQRRE